MKGPAIKLAEIGSTSFSKSLPSRGRHSRLAPDFESQSSSLFTRFPADCPSKNRHYFRINTQVSYLIPLNPTKNISPKIHPGPGGTGGAPSRTASMSSSNNDHLLFLLSRPFGKTVPNLARDAHSFVTVNFLVPRDFRVVPDKGRFSRVLAGILLNRLRLARI
jgi:hypothetical protein